MRFRLGLVLIAIITLGGGCTKSSLSSLAIFPEDLAAEEVDLSVGSTIVLDDGTGSPLDFAKKTQDRVVNLSEWLPGQKVAFTWSETFERETQDSIVARNEADRATGVGETVAVPNPVFETITLSGSIVSDGLAEADRMLLPESWAEGQVDLSGKNNSVLWLSTQNYQELVDTRHTHLELSSVDGGIQDALNVVEGIKAFIGKLQGDEQAVEAVADEDITEIVAEPEWGSYTLELNNKKVKVQTILAENKFASYEILANPENPLILRVELKPWSYGADALGSLSDDLNLAGYSIKSITQPQF